MVVVLAPSQSDIMAALRGFLLSILPPGVVVIAGQSNRVPEPAGSNYVVMTPIMRTRLSTNIDIYADPETQIGSRSIQTATRATIQIDAHGPGASDNTQVILAMFRDSFACEAFGKSSFTIQPLFTSDPRQMPFINDQQQYEDRWTLDAELQVNPVVSTTQQFADTLSAGLIEVDAAYPPGGN